MPSIFGTYDIRGPFDPRRRGISNIVITRETAYALGRGFFVFLKKLYRKNPSIALAIDLRQHSKILGAYFRRGFESSGGKVEYFGILPTPAFYFAVQEGVFDGGCMITASHLPQHFNGFKPVLKNAVMISEAGGLRFLQASLASSVDAPVTEKKILPLKPFIHRQFLERYIKKFFSLFSFSKKRKLAVYFDFKNTAATVFKIPLFKYLRKAGAWPYEKKIEHSDFSVAFDADADRVLFFNERGEEILKDAVALKVIEKNFPRGGTFIAAANTSKEPIERMRERGKKFKVVVSKVGHTLMKATMRKYDADFGYEASGHYFIGKFHNIESPPYMIFSIVKILQKTNQSASDVLRLSRYFIFPEMNFRVKNTDNALAEILRTYRRRAKKISRLEGLTLEFSDFWFNIRKSRTEPLLRLRLEAKNRQIAEEKLKELKKIIK